MCVNLPRCSTMQWSGSTRFVLYINMCPIMKEILYNLTTSTMTTIATLFFLKSCPLSLQIYYTVYSITFLPLGDFLEIKVDI